MISKLEILKFVSRVHKKGRGIQDRRLSHPQRDWLLGVSFFVLTTGAGAIFSLYSFEVYKTLDERSQVLERTTSVYDRGTVTDVLDFYLSRKNNFDALLGNVVAVPEVPQVATTTEATTTPSFVQEREPVAPSDGFDFNTEANEVAEPDWLQSVNSPVTDN